MGISFFGKSVFGKSEPFVKSDSKAENVVKATDVASRLRKILYLASCGVAMIAFCLAALSAAQEERPEITPQEKVVNKKKKGSEPRALGLLQLTSNGKATLVPIAILINGRFYDAASYKASPIPMALESGIVYEGERTGSSLGLFTVNGALHSKDANASNPWIGTGMWLLQGADVQKTTRKAENVPLGMETTDEPPRLTKGGKTQKDSGTESTPPNATSQTSAGSTSAGSSSPPGSKPADTSQPAPEQKPQDQTKPDQNRPDQTTPGQTAPGQATPGQTNPEQTKPDQNKPDQGQPATPDTSKSDQAAPAAGEDTNSQAGDANRPKLRRGKPTEPLPGDEDVPGYVKLGNAKPNAPAAATEKKPDAPTSQPDQSGAAKSPPQLVPAISDAAGPDPRSYVFEWLKGEEEDRRKQVLSLAQEQLRAYAQARAKGNIATKAAPGKPLPGARKQAAKTSDLVLEDAQMRTFDLWANNQPVIVFTAKAHPPLPGVGAPAADSVPEYSITLVARTDIYNNLHKLYAGVTDKYHLDVTPRLELIDAVDADGDGRGELLFRETSDAGSGYVIYRASADKLWKMFDSLNPE